MNTFDFYEFEHPTISFFGRSFAEYTRFFDLNPAALRGRKVLDVAAGPASFTAEAVRHGIDALAVDPLYGCTSGALEAHVQLDYRRIVAQLRAKPQLFQTAAGEAVGRSVFASLDEAEQDRRTAAAGFLADYENGFLYGRYVGGVLPRLPCPDRAFDMVLCAHLLFIHARHFDLVWHVDACRELARVASGEVRIHPVCGPDGQSYPGLDSLRGQLQEHGIMSEVVSVNYEFFVGSSSMLVLRPAAEQRL